MATSIGHSLLGMALATLSGKPLKPGNWPWYLFAVIAANAPDLDFIPGLMVGEANRYHQLASHSLGAAFAFGVLVEALARLVPDAPRMPGLWATVLYASHLLLDCLTLDARAPYGIPALWPFSDRHFTAPFSIFLNVQHGTAEGGVASFVADLLTVHNLGILLIETLLLSPVLILASWLAMQYGRGTAKDSAAPHIKE